MLVAEDNRDDVVLFEQSVRMAGLKNPVRFVGEQNELMDYLHGAGSFADRQQNPFPSLLLLDLNLPGAHGLEVIQRLRKENSPIAELPIIVITNSHSPRDIDKAYRSGANSFMVKPLTLKQSAEQLRATAEFWFAHVSLPSTFP